MRAQIRNGIKYVTGSMSTPIRIWICRRLCCIGTAAPILGIDIGMCSESWTWRIPDDLSCSLVLSARLMNIIFLKQQISHFSLLSGL